MAREQTDPKGMLIVEVALLLPPTDTMYRTLNHGCAPHRTHVLTFECTKDEGQQIIAKIRDANPTFSFPASWTGKDEL